ncbi:MAG: DUF5916 domain-containing protein, partial [Bacteroidales bacterium]
MVSLNPVAGKAPYQPTEVRMIHTDKYLYIGGWLYDGEPDQIRATSKIRDDLDLTNDWFGICLDSYLDKENALLFSTTPSGLRSDAQIYNDGQGSFPMKDWNTVWEVATSRDERGWYAEMQIPLSSLRYQKTGDEVLMGLCLFRYIPRVQEWDTYPAISNKWGFWSWAKPSQYAEIVFTGIETINPLYFAPYLLGGIEQKPARVDEGEDYQVKTALDGNIGMDVKYGLTKNLTLDLTLNTDFAQVEADDQQVNLTRFSLFFPEKRQFFLERSSIFDLEFGSTGQLFYSRRIGIHNGQQVPVWGGGRLTGRLGNWDIGVLALQTGFLKDPETQEEVLPTINNSVVRLRRKIGINDNSYLGAMSTLKVDPSGRYNWNYGLDAIINTFKNDYLTVALAQTLDSDNKPNLPSPGNSKYHVGYERRAYYGPSYELGFTRAGARYNPELGFEYRQDYTLASAMGGFGWNRAQKPGILRGQQLLLTGNAYYRNEDLGLETLMLTPAYDLTLKSLHNFVLKIPIQVDNFDETFYLSTEHYVPAGQYRFIQGSAEYYTPTWEKMTATIILTGGQYYDGWIRSARLSPSFRLAGSWIISPSYRINLIDFPSRD